MLKKRKVRKLQIVSKNINILDFCVVIAKIPICFTVFAKILACFHSWEFVLCCKRLDSQIFNNGCHVHLNSHPIIYIFLSKNHLQVKHLYMCAPNILLYFLEIRGISILTAWENEVNATSQYLCI